jgi:hypothetical protein
MVSQRADDLRKTISPGARLLHSDRTGSDFEAFCMKNAWRGFEPWRPEPDWEERFFTAEDLAEQASYLAVRKRRE